MHTRLLRWCCCCCRVTISSGTAETAVCMPLDQMVLLLLQLRHSQLHQPLVGGS
jgi:hypothetical protein